MMRTFKKSGGIVLASLLIVAVVAPTVLFPKKAEATIPVVEVGLNLVKSTVSAFANVGTSASTGLTAGTTGVSAIKDTRDTVETYVLKPLAMALARAAIKSITNSTVNWINGGFQGSPAFATDLKKNLRQAADGRAQEFISELVNNSSIHSPFIDSLVTNVGAAYYLYSSRDALATQLQDTLSESSRDATAFRAGDFSQGGWNAYWSTYMNPANNPFGAQMIASQALADRISSTINQRTQELAWGSGFLPWRGDCTPKNNASANNSAGNSAAQGVTLSDAEQCQDQEIQTPGSFIAHKLDKVTDSPQDQLLLAQSIDAIVGALAQQLISQALGGASGLRGSSKPAQGGGSTPATATNGTTQTAVVTTQEGLAVSMQTSISQVSAWRADSQTVANTALSAKSVCANNPATLAETVEPALSTSQAAIARADSLLASLSDLSTKLASGTAYQIVSSGYQQLLDTNQLPSTAVMMQASADAKDSGNSPVQSLYTQLSSLAANNCQDVTVTERVTDPGL